MKPEMSMALLIVMALIALSASGCAKKAPNEKLLLATTTSTYDSGLLDYLLPDFQAQHHIQVEVISVGSGQALKNGERGDVDVLFVHDPAGELAFVEKGYGIDRRCVMYNDFILVGPPEDPAGIRGLSLEEALGKISTKNAAFVSRGDDSGTDKKEKQLWKAFGIETPNGTWYKEVGAGMASTLRIADEKRAYTLADRGTFLSLNQTLGLVTIVEGDPLLLNPYGVIRVNPALHEGVHAEAAKTFEEWLMSEVTQEKIGGFQKNGEALFTPLRGKCGGG